MKAVILAGGLGTRISEESVFRPKPMIEIGGKPILWHIMKYYSFYGVNDFIICLGYKGYLIKEFFFNFNLHSSDVNINLKTNEINIFHNRVEPWNITLLDTGEFSQTGGRLKYIEKFLDDNEDFFLTYGDGLCNLNLNDELQFHLNHGKLATVCAVQPPGRFGSLLIHNNLVSGFQEKPAGDGGWISGGYFVLNSKVLKYIFDDQTVWENEPLKRLSEENNLVPFFHDGFWQPMDTLRDKNYIEGLIINNKAPWILWE